MVKLYFIIVMWAMLVPIAKFDQWLVRKTHKEIPKDFDLFRNYLLMSFIEVSLFTVGVVIGSVL